MRTFALRLMASLRARFADANRPLADARSWLLRREVLKEGTANAISTATTPTATSSSIRVKPRDLLARIRMAALTLDVPVHTALRLGRCARGRNLGLLAFERRILAAADAERHGLTIVQRHHAAH